MVFDGADAVPEADDSGKRAKLRSLSELGGPSAPVPVMDAPKLTEMLQFDVTAAVVNVVPDSVPPQPETAATSKPEFGVTVNVAVAPLATFAVAGEIVPPGAAVVEMTKVAEPGGFEVPVLPPPPHAASARLTSNIAI